MSASTLSISFLMNTMACTFILSFFSKVKIGFPKPSPELFVNTIHVLSHVYFAPLCKIRTGWSQHMSLFGGSILCAEKAYRPCQDLSRFNRTHWPRGLRLQSYWISPQVSCQCGSRLTSSQTWNRRIFPWELMHRVVNCANNFHLE